MNGLSLSGSPFGRGGSIARTAFRVWSALPFLIVERSLCEQFAEYSQQRTILANASGVSQMGVAGAVKPPRRALGADNAVNSSTQIETVSVFDQHAPRLGYCEERRVGQSQIDRADLRLTIARSWQRRVQRHHAHRRACACAGMNFGFLDT